MAVEWEKVPDRVVKMSREIIEEHHPWLRQAKIGLLFRSKAGSSRGRQVIGRAAKVNDQWRAILGNLGKLHFIIWFAKDWWDKATPAHKRALVDHELSHCTFGENGPAMRGHDIEEFNEIISRHGLWRDDLRSTAIAIQPYFKELREEDGEVVAIEPNGSNAVGMKTTALAREWIHNHPDVDVTLSRMGAQWTE